MYVHSIGVTDTAIRPIPALGTRNVARILLVDPDAASRSTLKSILETAGYWVDIARSSSEANAALETCEYELVLADLPGAEGPDLLDKARRMPFEPATGVMSSKLSEIDGMPDGPDPLQEVVHMSMRNVSYLLAGVAELLGQRADRRIGLSMRRVV